MNNKRGFATLAVLVAVLVSSVISLAGVIAVRHQTDEKISAVSEEIKSIDVSKPVLGADTVKLIAGFNYTLAGSGISSSGTSFSLTSLTLKQNGYAIQDSDLSSTFYLTMEPGSTSRQEIVSCTTVGANTGSTVTISGCVRGLSPLTPYTASTTLQFAHAGGTTVIFADPPQVFNQAAFKDNDETITGNWEFPVPTDPLNATTKTYVDGLALGGSPTVSNIVVSGTAGETITKGQIIYFDTIQDEWMRTDADFAASSTQVMLGVSQGAGVNGGSIASGVLLVGLDANNTGGVAGNDIYLSNTTGATSTTPGTFPKKIGIYRAAGSMYFDPYFDFPTLGSVNAWTATNTFATSSITIGSFPAYHIGKNIKVITTTGTTTFAIPSGVTKLKVQVQAGGGGGGNSGAATSAGGGGGGGGYAMEYVDVSATSTVQVHVGTGGATTGGGGNDGLWSTFGTNGFYLSASPGGGGNADSGTAGNGGIGSGGDFNVKGSAGCGGRAADADAPPTSVCGGGSHLGGGGQPFNAAIGGAGGQYGGGGAGGSAGNAGGAGADGVVIIEW